MVALAVLRGELFTPLDLIYSGGGLLVCFITVV